VNTDKPVKKSRTFHLTVLDVGLVIESKC